ncbi:MAG: GntR family transcriptional regulator [Ardenticatenaceae bacterium]|nr:GntR family transcriptional regulator [Ardenticatenaceae bacterium]
MSENLAEQKLPGFSSKKELAYEAIKESILSHSLRPGDAVSESAFAEALQISRTPVREALMALEQEGLVKIVPTRGIFVTEITVRDIREIYEIRQALECLAVRKAALTPDLSPLDPLLAVLETASRGRESVSYDSLFQVDIDLHRFIRDTARNSRLSQILENLQDQIHRIRVLSPRVDGRMDTTTREHLAIIHALKQRDPDLAAQAMREHLHNAQDNIINFLAY